LNPLAPEGNFVVIFAKKGRANPIASEHLGIMYANGTLVAALTRSALWSDYARAFTAATGLPVVLRPVQTWQLPPP
jgi:hypothetical protein